MSIVLQGSTSGSVTLQEPAVAGTTVLTLPATSGTILTTGSSGQSIPKAALPTGSVLQVVNAQFDNPTQLTTTSTTPISTVLTATITPTSSTSKILILTNTQLKNETTGSYGALAIYRGSSTSLGWNTWLAFGTNPSCVFTNVSNISYDSPVTTSATTYTLYFKAGAGTMSLFWGSGSSSTITLMEISA
jgi:hypothetical protein